ncbi:MAG: nucleotide exchange factor GrpE [Thermoplasmata archaeon]|nr:nucleotide exchange factor GrpE [Thermoplasmata archaeon]
MVKNVKGQKVRRISSEVVDEGDVVRVRFSVKGLRRSDLRVGLEGKTLFVSGVREGESYEGRRRISFYPGEVLIKRLERYVEDLARRGVDNVDLERLKAEREELAKRVHALQRDLDFLRRKAEEEKEVLAEKKASEAALHVIEVLDNVERAIDSVKGEGTAEGLKVLKRSIERTLEKMGVEEIEAEGKPLDPQLHHAVQTVLDPEKEEQMVVKVLQKGYMMGGRVLRPALVVVSRKE